MLDPKAIQQTYLVYGLTTEQLSDLAKLATSRDLEAGDLLCREGEKSDELFIVLEGRFAVKLGNGEQLAEIGAGSVIGEMGLIDPRPRSASVEATERARVVVFPTGELRHELVSDGNLGFVVLCNIARLLSERLRETDTKLAALMGASVEA